MDRREERQNGTGRKGRQRERDLAGKKSSKLVCSTQQPAGGTKGGVKLGQLGVAASRGWDQYSLFLSSALPRSRRPPATEGNYYTQGNATDREPLRLLFLSSSLALFLPRLFSFLFDGSLRARLAASPCTERNDEEEKKGEARPGFRGISDESVKERGKIWWKPEADISSLFFLCFLFQIYHWPTVTDERRDAPDFWGTVLLLN